MKNVQPSDNIFVAASAIPNAGRGVFAAKPIRAGDVIETCPVIAVPLSDSSNDDEKGLLTSYFFYFGDGLAMVLGYGSLYNHSYEPNATYDKKPSEGVVAFRAIADIAAGEEITVNYNNGDPNNKSTPMNRGVPPANV